MLAEVVPIEGLDRLSLVGQGGFATVYLIGVGLPEASVRRLPLSSFADIV